MKIEALFDTQNDQDLINHDWMNYYIDYTVLWNCFRKNETTESFEKIFQKYFRKSFYIC